jgi:hypothetical protein
MGRVLSDRHANVEFSEDDAVCRAHGANRPITDPPGNSQHRRPICAAWPMAKRIQSLFRSSARSTEDVARVKRFIQ